MSQYIPSIYPMGCSDYFYELRYKASSGNIPSLLIPLEIVGLLVTVIPSTALFCNEDESMAGQQWGSWGAQWLSLDSKTLKMWQVHGSQFPEPARHLWAGLVLQAPAFSLPWSGKSRMILDWNPGHGAEREKFWLAKGKGQIACYFHLENCPRTYVAAKSHKKACDFPSYND